MEDSGFEVGWIAVAKAGNGKLSSFISCSSSNFLPFLFLFLLSFVFAESKFEILKFQVRVGQFRFIAHGMDDGTAVQYVQRLTVNGQRSTGRFVVLMVLLRAYLQCFNFRSVFSSEYILVIHGLFVYLGAKETLQNNWLKQERARKRNWGFEEGSYECSSTVRRWLSRCRVDTVPGVISL